MSDDCGAWTNIVVEPDNEGRDRRDQAIASRQLHPSALTEQLATNEQTLRTISRELSFAIAQRCTQFVDRLERSVRRLEDDATAAVNAALSAQASRRNSAKAGDGVGAFLACDAALDAIKQAGAAADYCPRLAALIASG